MRYSCTSESGGVEQLDHNMDPWSPRRRGEVCGACRLVCLKKASLPRITDVASGTWNLKTGMAERLGDPDWRPFWKQLRLRLRFQPGPRTCLADWQTKAPSANSICREEWKSWRDVGGQVTTWSITRRRLATRSAAHIAKSWSFKELLA